MFNVSTAETRNIIRAIHDGYGFDFSGYTMSSLRLRISMILRDHNLLYPDLLISRLLEDPEFFDTFLLDISVGSPDLFRDPDLWIELRDTIIPELLHHHNQFEILIPSSVTGDELYSMAILVQESGWSDLITLTTTCLNDKIIKSIRTGMVDIGRQKSSQDNYRIFNPDGNPERYFHIQNGNVYRISEYLERVNFRVQKPTALQIDIQVKLILFRNRLLYVNQALKNRILRHIAGKMEKDAILILGIRESLKDSGIEKDLSPVSAELNILGKLQDE